MRRSLLPAKGFRRQRAPRSLARAVMIGWSVASAVGAIAACSAKSAAVGPGGECFLATDCAPGLVCIEQANKTRICSDDLSRVVGRTPPDGAAEVEDAASDGPRPDGGDAGTPPTPEAGPDTGTPEPDSGGPADAGDDAS